ncbi:permease-like cell division protein FtsX [Pontibacter sp. G13]|uniref:cell division protein FtsX n=1 Tax=Pontibacter sp. G13 TaxID=3074898 RepID=UPI00288B1441|nr:permease-like cell division protein FtsX [Pontibacter sp. G13]WNJ20842.1 permease-like cell division protein FtsX [Pontibacter sp. G13]
MELPNVGFLFGAERLSLLTMGLDRSTHSSQQFLRKRSRTTFLTSTLSIGLILFFFSLFVGISLLARMKARDLRSSIVLKVFLHDGFGTQQHAALEAKLQGEPFVQSMIFVSKDEAASIFLERRDEDVRQLMQGSNPLPASFNITLKPSYLIGDSLPAIQARLQRELLVSDVRYDGERIETFNRNISVLSGVGGLMGILLLGITFYLVFATIRLSIYAQRLTLRSMQLIGATDGFIRRPFLINGSLQGMLGGLVACGLLVGTMLGLKPVLTNWLLEWEPAEFFLLPTGELIGLFGGIVFLGAVLGFAGSLYAVNKYLSSNLDELM